MAHALSVSASEHNPSWRVIVERIDSDSRGTFGTNSAKLARWASFIESCADGERVLLIDADCYVRSPLHTAFAAPFDIAFTRKKEHGPLPFNAGVVVVRVSDTSKRFMRQWLALNDAFMADRNSYTPYERRFGGINQAALGALLERGGHGATIEWLAASEFNSCHAPLWCNPGRIVHVKSHLRKAVIMRLARGPYAPLIIEWWAYAERSAVCD
jgi:hypothetical protein